jgi:hypothetical protein
MPKIRANQASVLAVPVTRSAFGFTDASQPAAMTVVFVHFALYVYWKSVMFAGVLSFAYSSAVLNATATSGRSCAPARAAASVAVCSWRLA